MAIPLNGYLDDAAAYEFAKGRFPNNFTAPAPSASFVANLRVAGDIVNSNDDVFIGAKRAGLTGGRVWPRQLEGGGDAAPFLTDELPMPLLEGYQWLAIGVALNPEKFGTISDSSTTVITGAGGLTEAQWGNLKVKLETPSTKRTNSQGVEQEIPFELQFHFRQALSFFIQLVRPGEEFRIPGLTEQREQEDQPFESSMSQFMTVRV